MKQKDMLVLGVTALIAAIFSFVLSNVIFGSPQKNPIKVPVVTNISSNFPDVKNDSDYNSFFNSNALNPTQLIQIGNNKNNAPFQNNQTQ